VREILTPEQVARLLEMHAKTVYKLVRQGVLPGLKIGGVWRFSKAEILEMMAGNRRRVKKPIKTRGSW